MRQLSDGCEEITADGADLAGVLLLRVALSMYAIVEEEDDEEEDGEEDCCRTRKRVRKTQRGSWRQQSGAWTIYVKKVAGV